VCIAAVLCCDSLNAAQLHQECFARSAVDMWWTPPSTILVHACLLRHLFLVLVLLSSLQSSVLLNAGPAGVPAGAPLSANLLGVDTFLPLRLRRTAVRRLGGIMAAEGCNCQRCTAEVRAALLLLCCSCCCCCCCCCSCCCCCCSSAAAQAARITGSAWCSVRFCLLGGAVVDV
jgi:hypothetical protein